MVHSFWSVYAATTASVQEIQWNYLHRTITIEQTEITLTGMEYHLLSALRYGLPVSYADLIHTLYGCDEYDKVRMALDKHIDRIRYKLKETNVSVYCVLDYGYVLLSRAKKATATEAQ